MLTQKFYFPEETTGAPAMYAPNTPQSDIDLLTVALRVGEAWSDNNAITLLWTDAVSYNSKAALYKDALSTRMEVGSKRPAQTQALRVLDKMIDDGCREVKIYIRKKFRDSAEAQYARFGIVRERNSYMFPRDRDHRLAALPLMVSAIQQEGFATEEYGLDFWNNLRTNYAEALNTTGATDSALSGKVADKNQLKAYIKKVHSALRLTLRANYPDTYKEVYRQWGWQKEDY